MRAIALACLFLAGCAAQSGEMTLLSPCPAAALPTCHAQAAGCRAAPYCYRTLGQVDCYPDAELARRTVEEVVPPPTDCYALSPLVRAG
jgi:hypothetical protein